jgi:hypothetical protein
MRRYVKQLGLLASCASVAAMVPVALSGPRSVAPAPEQGPEQGPEQALDQAVDEALDGLIWVAMDMHLHTDHSSDGGLFHQQEKDQRNQDTFLDEQRDQALRMGMDGVAFTDHRNFGQHYDPGFMLDTDNPLVDQQFLVTGQEWGGGRHGTAFATMRRIDHGSTDLLGCGLAQMALEVAAQDGLLGIAHPKDKGADACMSELVSYPLSHVEALRGGDNELAHQHDAPGGGNGSNVAWYQAFSAAGGRSAAVNGSDNHFKQVWAGPPGPGGSAAYVLVEAGSADPEAAFVEAVRARRTLGGWGAGNARLVTLLDADMDGTFDALTGGVAVPTSDTVTVAVRVTGATAGVALGHTVQLVDDQGVIVAQEAITSPVQTMSWTLPASSDFYRAMVSSVAASQIGLPDPLDYIDTRIMSSTPVWTTPDTTYGTDPVATGIVSLGGGDFSGFGDLAEDGAGTLHAVWVERRGTARSLWVARSLDDGASWQDVRALPDTLGARTPTIVADDELLLLAWEAHDPTRFGGSIHTASSTDEGITWVQSDLAFGRNAARPDLAAHGGRQQLVWQEQQLDDTWAIVHQSFESGSPSGKLTTVSSARPVNGGQTNVALPPRALMHIPASVEPTVTARDGFVAVAWEDNRDDPTPGRSGAPDDWAIFGTVSTDGGATFGSDVRWTDNPRRQDDDTDPEGVEGNPALDADLVVTTDGQLVLAFTQTDVSGTTDVWTRTGFADGNVARWNEAIRVAATGSWSSHPQLARQGAGAHLVWQEATEATWHLVRTASVDLAGAWSTPEAITEATRYAGWHALAGDHLIMTAEDANGAARTYTMRHR